MLQYKINIKETFPTAFLAEQNKTSSELYTGNLSDHASFY